MRRLAKITHTSNAEIGELLHAIFAILMATCVTSGLIGTILLSTHGKIIKNAQFQVLKVVQLASYRARHTHRPYNLDCLCSMAR